MASNLRSLIRHLRKRPYAKKVDGDFATMRAAEQKRRRRMVRNLSLLADGILPPGGLLQPKD